jgi:anti-repressor protein
MEKQETIVNGAGFYRLAFQSKESGAKEFQRWVFHEVLPQIRKTGGYGVSSTMNDGGPLDVLEFVLHGKGSWEKINEQ